MKVDSARGEKDFVSVCFPIPCQVGSLYAFLMGSEAHISVHTVQNGLVMGKQRICALEVLKFWHCSAEDLAI